MTILESWIVEQGLHGSSLGALFSGVAERLLAEGIPLVRAYLALPTVNPTIRVHTHCWTRQGGMVVDAVSHERNVDAIASSPFGHMLRTGLTKRHWRFNEFGVEPFDVFEDIKHQGGKDYLVRLIPFENASAPDLQGIAAAFSSDREGGLLPDEIARIDALMPLLGLATYRVALFDLTVTMLDTYVGLAAGRRVLSGEFRRGSGTTLTAALLFADLRGFTSLSDAVGAPVITRLDQHLEAMAEPVSKHGGEVLKFLGDGVLAVLPITEERPEEAACAAAVRTTLEILARNEEVNRARPGEPSLGVDIALHFGDVFYGNIGAAGRLEFTVIGPAVNEVSRMEALCGQLDCSVIMSAVVAAASPLPVRSIGRHTLRGVTEQRELFTLAA
jgi:adenylate cyclase